MDLRPGERFDRYVLVELLGEGGQGSVWKIVDPTLGVVRALKLLDLRRLPPSAVARAKIEAEAVNRLADHPAIVPCHDVLSSPGGLLGLVFDLVRGQPLAALLDDARLAAAERRAVLGQLASALAHVHARGILHRDLKPDNVLVTDAFWSDPRAPGGVKLVDFGIASSTESPAGLTVGAFVGTVAYLPPEVLLPGRWPARSPGPARDVFAFGVLAWELLAGGHPAGLSPDVPEKAYALAYTDAALGKRPWPPPGSPGDLADAIAACLTLDPGGRPVDGAAIERLLPATTSPRPVGRTKPHRALTTDPEVVPPSSSEIPPTTVHARAGSPRTTPAPPTIEMTLGASPPGRPPPSHRGRSAPHDPDAVSPIPAPPAPARRGKGSILAPLAAALGAAVVAGALTHLVTRDPLEHSSPPPPSPPPSPSPLPTGVARGSAQSSMPCCGDRHACNSGHACAPGPCPISVLPERGWYLRLSGAAHGAEPAFPDDLARTHPYARVCARGRAAGGAPVCAPLTKMAATLDGDRAHRARVLTSDLEGGGVEIRIEEGTAVLAEGASASNPDGLQMGTLCSGLRLYVGSRATATYIVRGYLDED